MACADTWLCHLSGRLSISLLGDWLHEWLDPRALDLVAVYPLPGGKARGAGEVTLQTLCLTTLPAVIEGCGEFQFGLNGCQEYLHGGRFRSGTCKEPQLP